MHKNILVSRDFLGKKKDREKELRKKKKITRERRKEKRKKVKNQINGRKASLIHLFSVKLFSL